MRVMIRRACAALLVSASVVSAAPVETFSIHDAGQPRVFELALDEIAVSGPGLVRRGIEKIPAAADRAALRDAVARRPKAAGETVELVLYEVVNGERQAGGTRVLTRDVLLEIEPGADAAALARDAGATAAIPTDAGPTWWTVRAADAASALDLAAALRGQPGVRSAEPMLARKQTKKLLPNDTLFGSQWHLRNTGQFSGVAGVDIRVTNVWDTYRGTNIFIAIIDDGLQTAHPDLAPNVNTLIDYDINYNDGDPSPDQPLDDHGTACAGVAAARGNNGIGVSGSAPEATLVGLRLISTFASDADEALAMNWSNSLIQIKSNSWGPTDDGARLEGPGSLTLAALSNACITGRGGRGVLNFWAGGNGNTEFDDSNYDGYANSIYTIAIGAVCNVGTQSWYSEPGANLVVVAPSSGDNSLGQEIGIYTTDRTGSAGYNNGSTPGEPSDANYTATFGGTSSATPLAAGVGALVLQANPNLGWRDVQEILMRTATQNDLTASDWVTNAAGFRFNHKYGAGMINASGAVARALTWTNLGPQIALASAQTGLSVPIPDNNPVGIERTFSIVSGMRVEHATLNVSATHPYRGDLVIELISPNNTTSTLADVHGDSNANISNWRYMTVRNWGETANGTWKVRIADLGASDVGTLTALTLTLYGTSGIAPSNQPPVLTPIGPKSVVESNALVFAVTASDPVDGDPVTLSAANLPAGATFSSTNGNGTFSWPSPAPTGSYVVTFSAADIHGTNSEAVAISVTATPVIDTNCTVIISEYVEGSSNNKAIELFNPGPSSVNLAGEGYVLQNYNNGSSTPSYTLSLTGTIASGATFVIVNNQAGATLQGFANLLTTSQALTFNGDDALVLRRGTNVVDSLGQTGVDPGAEWGSGLTSTADNTLRRLPAVSRGDMVINDAFTPSSEWEGFAQDTFTGLGSHTNACTGGSPVPGGPPILDAIGAKSTTISNALQFLVSAIPTDGDPVTLIASNLPPGASFGSTNEIGSFTWPVPAPVGVVTVLFYAVDADGADSEAVILTVGAAGTGGTETFTQFNGSESTYVSGSYVGDTSIGWAYRGARRPADLQYQIDGASLGFGDSSRDPRDLESDPISGGIGDLSIKYLQYFTGAGTRSFDVFVNNALVGQVADANNTTAATATFPGINVAGDVVIKIVATGEKQVVIDTLTWSSFGGAPDPDSDGDGIPDAWEIDNFGSVTNVNASSDWDGDTVSDGDEFVAGTDPDDINSFLEVLESAVEGATGGVVIQWPGVTGKVYAVSRGTDLLDGASFSLIATNIAGVSPLNSYTDAPPTPANAIYRIGVGP